MNRHIWLLVAFSIGLLGCAHPPWQQQSRLQAPEEPEKKKDIQVQTIGDVTSVGNVNPVPVSGVGLVVGLDGTGGGVPPGGYRAMLENHLLKEHKVTNAKELLDSPNTSVVLVSGVVPAGARKGEALDLEIVVPRESRTTSLRGGQLLRCVLFEHASKKSLSEKYAGPDGTVAGHGLVKAEGPVLVGFGEGDDASRLRQGRIWGGGKCKIDRPFYLSLNQNKQFYRLAQAVSDRVNETFHATGLGSKNALAEAKTKAAVYMTLPPQYRLNLPRYLRVVRLIPIEENEASRIAYRRQLEEQLLDPARTITAALRLEALGTDSVPTLKRALVSEHPLVRFSAAEALAYLGSPSCGEELARAVREQPALRAFCLTALASLDEAVCHIELRRLLDEVSPEAKYGAFRALRALDEREEAVQGELMNDSYWLHQVAPQSQPLVHISTTGRAEIVIFGDNVSLVPPFPILAGEFTITAKKDDDKCTVTRTSLRTGKSQRQCSLKLDEVLRTIAEMGGLYPDAVELLRRAERIQCLSCQVVVDALPQATSVFDLAKAGAGDAELLKTHPEILEAKSEFGATPTLFERGSLAPRVD